ncbi:MAG: ATP synthase F0 subunit B [Myxococcota bacterium]
MPKSLISSAAVMRKLRASSRTKGPACFAVSLTFLLGVFFTGAASASDKLQLVPDFGLFNWFGESYFGDLWVMLLGFVLLVFPLNGLIFQPIFRSLDARAEKISGARERSSDLQRQADAVLDRYETAIREARGESEKARQGQLLRAREEQASLTAAARSEAERELEKARGELGRSLEAARTSLRAGAQELAEAAAEQVLGRPLS